MKRFVTWAGVYRLLLAVLGLQRLLELLISRRNERRSADVLGRAGRRSYPLMVVLHVALFGLPLLETRLRPRTPRPALVAPALAGLAAATALRLWVIRSLGNGWNVRAAVPIDLVVVDSGPYRFVRHPNYVAVAVEMAALPLAGPAPLSAAALTAANVLVLLPRIRGEEALLATVAGYAQRMDGKPRFIPRLRICRTRPDKRSPAGQRDAGESSVSS